MAGRAGASRASGPGVQRLPRPPVPGAYPGRPRGGAQPVLPAAAHASCRRQGGRGWCPPRARVEAPHDQSPGPAVGTSGCTPSGHRSLAWLPASGQRLTHSLLLLIWKVLPSSFCPGAGAAVLCTGPCWGGAGSRDGETGMQRYTDSEIETER